MSFRVTMEKLVSTGISFDWNDGPVVVEVVVNGTEKVPT